MSKYKKNKAVALRYNVDEDTSPVYEVVAAIYCKLIETSAQIRGVEKSRSESASAGHKEEASQPGRLRRNLVSRHSKDDSQQTV